MGATYKTLNASPAAYADLRAIARQHRIPLTRLTNTMIYDFVQRHAQNPLIVYGRDYPLPDATVPETPGEEENQ